MSTRKINVEIGSKCHKTPFFLNTTTENAWLISSVTIFHCECLMFMWLFVSRCKLLKSRVSVLFTSVSLASDSNSVNVENILNISSHFMYYSINQSIVDLFFLEKTELKF